eukprot:Colp12_sorted_trinity150504_noHs@5700
MEQFLNEKFDEKFFLELLEKLIAETPKLVNMPPKFIPEEDAAGQHVLDALRPFTVENGGPLIVRQIHYVPKRGHIIIRYPGTTDKTVAFVGSHLDVVHADPSKWERDPFKLQVEGDLLYGRGTTDCLGHVALQTTLFRTLAMQRPPLTCSVVGVIIVDEEAGNDSSVGVEALAANGELKDLKNGPVIWLDCADKQPNIGSGGVVGWRLTAHGKLCHSGFPHKGVNAIELAHEATAFVQHRFYADFPKHEHEARYGFECSSSLKPTRTRTPEGGLNQIPQECVVEGDIRLIPFYSIKECMRKVEAYVADFNEKLDAHPKRGPDSKFRTQDTQGRVELEWLGDGCQGLACNLDSIGFHALVNATREVVGHAQPIADTGSLPLVADLQAAGYDIQTVGYGVEDAYHADNEYARLSDYEQGFRVLVKVIDSVNRS